MKIYSENIVLFCFGLSNVKMHSGAGQERVHLGSAGGASAAAKLRTFEGGGGSAEAYGGKLVTAFRQGERDAGMKDVAGRERIDGVNGEYRYLSHGTVADVEHVAGAIAHREKRLGQWGDALQALGKIGAARGLTQAFR